MDTIGIGLIGTGFMGKCHALAYGSVKRVFGDVPTPRLELLCEQPADKAQALAEQFGFARSTDDWRALVADPAVDLVAITTPNKLHPEIAIAALQAGKHVHCEKPMAVTLAEAEAMHAAASNTPGKTVVGYNYIQNPAFTHIKRLISDGAIGEPTHFRGFCDEDYQADPGLPWTWRATKAEAGLGVLGDLGCHIVSLALGLMGPIATLTADLQIVHKTRLTPDGERKPVENEDIATMLITFENGAGGLISTSRSAWGRKSYLAFEVHGTQGMIRFDQERMNEIALYQNSGPKAEQGFKTILTGPEHPPYAAFCPAPGHQIGFNEMKVIEVYQFLRAIAEDRPAYPAFSDALEIERIMHAAARSAEGGGRVSMSDMRTSFKR